MYTNIGRKIKYLAKTMFIIATIVFVIAGIALLTSEENSDDNLLLAGLTTIFCGPIIAGIGTWILYAFGELVEDVHAIRAQASNGHIVSTPESSESNLPQISELFHDDSSSNCEKKPSNIPSTKTGERLHKAVQCECGELHYARYCPVCGKKATTSAPNLQQASKIEDKPQPKSTVCKCGERFYGVTCPNCGRNIKDI